MQRFATILSEGIAAHNIGSEIESIKMKITNLKMNFRDYGIKESIIQGEFLQRDEEGNRVASICEEILIKVNEKERDGIQMLKDADIIEKLREILCAKKFLVILDDIWDIETWNILCEAFPMKNTSSKILLTSHNGDVALYVDFIGFHHKLHCLNEERSWELLEKIAISWRKGIATNFLLW
ncbi:hypothetical protein CMV_018749 [Castanea mollissima]|uniref:NB-ARC domain-containing protein n=1 Tax=Castanea mollissima TaxID=60419 RepID=A0A8J4QR70_9ROSI|nr:hypothetical protein CMV_018749 [Castanea mollissima]